MIHGKYGRVLGMILAGGKGERLMPLTRYRAKPAVPFAAKYRIIDFALSNMVNSGLFSIYCLIQFKSQSLHEHIGKGWQFGDALRGRDFFINVVPAQMWDGERWYEGTADAIFQNMHLVTLFDADRRRVRRPLLRGEPVRMHRHRRDGTHHRFRRETRRSAGDPRTPRLQLRFDGQLHL